MTRRCPRIFLNVSNVSLAVVVGSARRGKQNIKAIILVSSLSADLWEINEREIKLCLLMCTLCPPANPSARPLEVSGPHFENHCPKWLIKLLYFRAPYGHWDQRKHLLGGPPRDTFQFYGGWLLTQSPLSDGASLLSHHPYRVSVRHADQSGQVKMTNSTNFPLFSEKVTSSK